MIPDYPSAFEGLPDAIREPSTEIRRMARIHRACFDAYLDEKFTEDQALDLVKTLIQQHGKG